MRTSTNVGIAAGLAVITMWLLGYFAPDLMTAAPVGLEAAITGVIAVVVARFSKTPANPGAF